MPYDKFRHGDKICIYRKDSEGKPVGKSLGCHSGPDAEKDANRQLAAIHVNEDKSMNPLKARKKEGPNSYPSSAYLVAEGSEPSEWHLRVKDASGKPSHRHMGAAWAALHQGYRGNKYEGPQKEEAIKKLRALYKREGMTPPGEKDSEKKSISLNELSEKVSEAIKKKIRDAIGLHDSDYISVWVDALWDAAIIHAPAGLFRADWDIVDEDTYEIEIGEPVPVKVEFVEVDAEPEGDTEDAAFAAIMHKAIDLEAIKSISEDRVGGYAILWGDEERKDLDGDWFTPETEELTTIFDAMGKLPFIYHHGMDKALKTSVIGIVDTLKPDHVGLWYEAQLKMSDDYGKVIKKLIENGKLKTSSQTFPIAIRKSENGKLLRWPIVEITATPTPAEYRMQPIAVLKGAYQSVGCTDFDCMLKNKLGIDLGEGDGQGTEKVRLALELERSRLAFVEL